jgi:protein-disulfide reductase (glutathione)
MNRFATVLLLACAVWLPVTASARPADHADLFNGAEINWRDARSGIYEATQTGKPVIMVFHATWCSACKKYRAVFSDAAIVAATKDFVMILVDADKDKQINGAFSPDGTYVPRTLFVDTDGNVSTALVGKDPAYPHTIDIGKPDELLALMLKAKADGFGPVGKPADEPSAEPGKGT